MTGRRPRDTWRGGGRRDAPRACWGAWPADTLVSDTLSDSGLHTATVNSWCCQPPVSGALSQRPQETTTRGRWTVDWVGPAAAPSWQSLGRSMRRDGAQRVSSSWDNPRSSAWVRDQVSRLHPSRAATGRRDPAPSQRGGRGGWRTAMSSGHHRPPAASPTKSLAGEVTSQARPEAEL